MLIVVSIVEIPQVEKFSVPGLAGEKVYQRSRPTEVSHAAVPSMVASVVSKSLRPSCASMALTQLSFTGLAGA